MCRRERGNGGTKNKWKVWGLSMQRSLDFPFFFGLTVQQQDKAPERPARVLETRSRHAGRRSGHAPREAPAPAGGSDLGASPTSTGGQRAAPLAAAPALGPGRPLQHVAGIAGEVDHVVQVELAAVGEPVRRVPGVTTRDGCGGRQVRVKGRRRARLAPTGGAFP